MTRTPTRVRGIRLMTRTLTREAKNKTDDWDTYQREGKEQD